MERRKGRRRQASALRLPEEQSLSVAQCFAVLVAPRRTTIPDPEITYDLRRKDLEKVADFVAGEYWAGKISAKKRIEAFRFSFCVGVLVDGGLVAFARAISDKRTCAHIKDVLVFTEHRGQGLGKLVMQGLLDHPDLAEVERWYLGTKDAHEFYRQFGFRDARDGIYMFADIARTGID